MAYFRLGKLRFRYFILLAIVYLIELSRCDNIFSPIEEESAESSASSSSPLLSTSLLSSSSSKCEPLNTDLIILCKDIAYNMTRFPNFMKQKTQQEAAADTAIFLPLVKMNCSPVLQLFLCSLYAPPCVENYLAALKPCREMCEKVKSGCSGFMKQFQFSWPDYIDCWRFPSFYSAEACVTDENYSLQSKPMLPKPQISSQFDNSEKSKNPFDLFNGLNREQKQFLLNSLSVNTPATDRNQLSGLDLLQNNNLYKMYAAAMAEAVAAAAEKTSSVNVKFTCPPVLQIVDSKNSYYLNVNDEAYADCGMPCDNSLFTKSEISFARSWVLTWSILCFLSTAFTILTFMIEASRFNYPERPIIFLSGCYLLVSLAYLIGSSSQNEENFIVCRAQKNKLHESKEYLMQGVEQVPCTVLFMIIYFFGMASSVWWIVLTLTWFLAAGLKWGHEAIENIASYFHLAAWGIPGIKLIAILWLQKVDADILSGVCYTGLRNVNLMRGFVLAPLIVYLIVGCALLFTGFFSLIRFRNVMKLEGNKTSKLERFMVRIGVFSILYIIPAIIVICCYFYEQSSYSKWIDYWLKHNFQAFNLPPDFAMTSLFENDRSSLIFSLFMIKYAMILVVGITSSFWIWSNKTLRSWQRFLDRLFVCISHLRPKYKNEAAV